mmetsp:Transcript_10651/g.15031  ORF Transcript_10651/g.15031 Transcript_10651/m.15031 type:complete len:469 (+) Transcript_10651:138-1544(+)
MKQIFNRSVRLLAVLLLVSFAVNAHDVCVDISFKFKLFNKRKRCSDFNPSHKHCKKNSTVRENCPVTCGLCEELCQDHVTNNSRICSFLNQDKRICSEDDVFEAICPEECHVEWNQLGIDIDGKPYDYSGYSVAASSDGLTVAIGNNSRRSSRPVRIYNYEDNDWRQLGTDIKSEFANDYFGTSVSISSDGRTVAIGASVLGYARIFKYGSDNWIQLGSDIDGETPGDNSGMSVSISGDGQTVAVGAPAFDVGYARVYQYITNNWIKLGNDIGGRSVNDWFGRSVSMSSDGRIVAVGARSNYVRIYKYENNNWAQLGNDINGHGGFGRSVSISADGLNVVIGASYHNYARIVKYENNDWAQVGNDIGGEAFHDRFGWSVSISANGHTVAIGARNNRGIIGYRSGHVRIYKLKNNNWAQIGTDIDGRRRKDLAGAASISADGMIVAVGGPHHYTTGNDAGHVRVFSLYQ